MSDQQFRRDLICAALTGLRANSSFAESRDDYGAEAVRLADAALAAAGEQEPTTSDADAKWMLDKIDELRAENARLKRLLEPLTDEELDAVIPDMRRCDGMKYGQMALYLDGVFSTVKNRRA